MASSVKLGPLQPTIVTSSASETLRPASAVSFAAKASELQVLSSLELVSWPILLILHWPMAAHVHAKNPKDVQDDPEKMLTTT